MADTPKDKEIGEAFGRLSDLVAKEIEQYKAEDINLEDMEDVSGGWRVSYVVDPPAP